VRNLSGYTPKIFYFFVKLHPLQSLSFQGKYLDELARVNVAIQHKELMTRHKSEHRQYLKCQLNPIRHKVTCH
jgi:hypothetical protein